MFALMFSKSSATYFFVCGKGLNRRHNPKKLVSLSMCKTRSHMQTETTFENIVTKEEIAHLDQFLLLPQCFKHD